MPPVSHMTSYIITHLSDSFTSIKWSICVKLCPHAVVRSGDYYLFETDSEEEDVEEEKKEEHGKKEEEVPEKSAFQVRLCT